MRAVRDAHEEALALLSTGRADVLHTYTCAAACQVAAWMGALRARGAALRAASAPAFREIWIDGDRAVLVTRTEIDLTYAGSAAETLVAEITWHLLAIGGRWLVDRLETKFETA